MAEDIAVRSLFRDYVVEFGDDALGALAARLDPDRTFVVCDERVAGLWASYLAPVLRPGRHLLVAPSEDSKTLDHCQSIIGSLVHAGTRRDHVVVAIGGGITQDVTAFAASILYRGIEWVFIPTTLLAQADSCVGSKTSINVGAAKNLVGNFWPPARAVIDTRFLDSLPADDVRSGIGEMLHFYLYADSPLTAALVAGYDALLERRSGLAPFIHESLRIKKRVAELDEFDRGERHKFNYGHTFGHALESATGYAVPHGLAVTVGMDIANFVSLRMGLMEEPVFQAVHAQLAVNLPPRTAGWTLDSYCAFLRKDKKNLGDTVGCILAERPGALVARQVAMEVLRPLLEEYLAGPWWP